MYNIYRMKKLPDNFHEFVDEIAAGIGRLYGIEAGREYRRTARQAVQATVRSPSAYVIATGGVEDTAGFLVSARHGNVARISFLHVPARHAGRGVEQALVEECVQTFRAADVDGILSECVAFCPLHVADVYAALGFKRVDRAIMSVPLQALGLDGAAAFPTALLGEPGFAEAARVIVDAYGEHIDRDLHAEVRTENSALDFVRDVWRDDYGDVRPGYLRAVQQRNDLAGVILGCQVAPGYGFVLQVAVRRIFQGRGIGTRLLADLAREFQDGGVTHLALGVTLANPALRLYTRLGFRPVHPVDAYVWWRT